MGQAFVNFLWFLQKVVLAILFVDWVRKIYALTFSPEKHYRLTCQTCLQEQVVNGPELRELVRWKLQWEVRTLQREESFINCFVGLVR